MKGIFVSGTGTGVGKSMASLWICQELHRLKEKVSYWKVIQCGEAEWAGQKYSGDAEWIRSFVDIHVEEFKRLQTPSSPHWAFAIENEKFDIERVKASLQKKQDSDDFWVVEGAGGVLVPISEDWDMIDLAREVHVPMLIVASPLLGTINHTRMTLEIAQRHELPIKGFVFSQTESNQHMDPYILDSAKQIEMKSKVPFLGFIPFFNGKTFEKTHSLTFKIEKICLKSFH